MMRRCRLDTRPWGATEHQWEARCAPHSLLETPPQAGSYSRAPGMRVWPPCLCTCHADTHGAAEGKERDGGRGCATRDRVRRWASRRKQPTRAQRRDETFNPANGALSRGSSCWVGNFPSAQPRVAGEGGGMDTRGRLLDFPFRVAGRERQGQEF